MTVLLEDAEAAYDAMAPFYDRFTEHHDYEAWTRTLERLAEAHGLSGRRLLDVGCGTGKSFLPFLGRGYDVVACDLSPRMAALAAEKAPGVDVHVCDVAALPRLGRFDLVCCLDDCLNHLLDHASLERAFRGIAANLAPGGLVVFDLNTLATYRGFFASTSLHDAGELVMVWSGATPADAAPGVLATARFIAFSRADDGSWTAARVTHRQRHHREQDVRRALAAAGLRCAGLYGQGVDGIPHPRLRELADTKAVYVARHAR